MNARTCLMVIASTPGLIVVGTVVGNVRESAGILCRETLSPTCWVGPLVLSSIFTSIDLKVAVLLDK
jgi:hypothetical protein